MTASIASPSAHEKSGGATRPADTVFLLGASSDIGTALATQFASDGFRVVGTYRDHRPVRRLEQAGCAQLIHCDVGDPESVRAAVAAFASAGHAWNIFVSAVGTERPIGPFFTRDFDEWERSIIVNSTAQLRMLHGLFTYREPDSVSHAAFFAGGGTNNAFPNYSAYCASKILLIKMCELLHAEEPHLNTFIVGPGWVRTKIHQETLESGAAAGANLARTQEFLSSGETGTPMEDIYACIQWCIEQGREIAGGRNFSVVHDSWREGGTALASQLRQSPDKFRLRRAGNEGLPASPAVRV